MKNARTKFHLVASIFETIIGSLAIISFFYLYFKGEDISNFWPALIVAISLTLTGIVGIVQYNKIKKIDENKTEEQEKNKAKK